MNYNTIIPPFKWFVLENFPYIEDDFDALTNWQLFCKLGKEINKVIEKTNLTGEQVENLTNAFNSLQNYVNNYFENLDIQEEVNTKLDEMAESGELAELVSQYLDSQAIIGFNTCSSLASATNVANGSFAKTYGRYTYNDSFGAFYKIRTRTNADDPDGYNIIVLTNTENLVAEKMNNMINYITPELFGAVGDGTTNDSTAFANFLNDSCNVKIMSPNKTYLISGLNLNKSNVHIYGNNSTLKLVGEKTNNHMIVIDSYNQDINNLQFEDIIFDGNKDNETSTITPALRIIGQNNHKVNNIKIKNCKFNNMKGYAIGNYNNDNPDSSYFKNIIIENCDFDTSVIAVQQSQCESKIINCTITNTTAENITIDNGCKNCYVENSTLSKYGHGGCIGIDQADNVYIINNTIDGTNNTASSQEDYGNGITINSNTGVCTNIIISSNVIKSNYNGISIGSPITAENDVVKGLIISNNTFDTNTNNIYARVCTINSRVKIKDNTYLSTTSYSFKTLLNTSIITNAFVSEIPYNISISGENSFTITRNTTKYVNGILYLNMVITYPSSIPTAGWKTMFSLPKVPSTGYNELKEMLLTSSAIKGLRDSTVYNDKYNVYAETGDINSIILLNKQIILNY